MRNYGGSRSSSRYGSYLKPVFPTEKSEVQERMQIYEAKLNSVNKSLKFQKGYADAKIDNRIKTQKRKLQSLYDSVTTGRRRQFPNEVAQTTGCVEIISPPSPLKVDSPCRKNKMRFVHFESSEGVIGDQGQ